MALERQNRAGLGSNETGARQDHDRQLDITQQAEVEIELTESEPTIQQRQAYEQFWKLFIERIVTERALDKNA
jgi:hypothetical protein